MTPRPAAAALVFLAALDAAGALQLGPAHGYAAAAAAVSRLYPDAAAATRQASGQAVMACDMDRELTYGEFEMATALRCIDAAAALVADRPEGARLRFVDVGSGTGRIAVGCALADGVGAARWSHAGGCEVRRDLADLADAAAAKRPPRTETQLQFECADLLAPSRAAADLLRQADVLFCYSTAFPARDDGGLTTLSYALGTGCRQGAVVVTTDKFLVSDGPWSWTLVDALEVPNSGTAVGSARAYFHVLERSDRISDSAPRADPRELPRSR